MPLAVETKFALYAEVDYWDVSSFFEIVYSLWQILKNSWLGLSLHHQINMWTLCNRMWPACAEFDIKPSVFGHPNEGVLAWDG